MSDRVSSRAALLEMRRAIVAAVLRRRGKRLTAEALYALTLEKDLADYQVGRIAPELTRRRTVFHVVLDRIKRLPLLSRLRWSCFDPLV